jgi:hypothetical protein
MEKNTSILILKDEDNDNLRIKNGVGFGYPALVLSVEQEGDYCGFILTTETAAQLHSVLEAFIKENTKKEYHHEVESL